MFTRLRVIPVALLAVTALATTACGGGSKTYKEGTPAATGEAPDCSVAPLDFVRKTLKHAELNGPVAEPKVAGGGWVCTFSRPRTGVTQVEQVQLISHATEETMAQGRESYTSNNNKVNKIKGYGDEAYATTVHFFGNSNNFVARKGKVAVHITSVSDYDNIRKLMKEILAKL